MKLRNKKTGEIGNLVLNINPNRESFAVLSTEDGDTICGNLVIADYDSLAELNEEWEDTPEEPKYIWWLDNEGNVIHTSNVDDYMFKKNKEIGNYFETEEEAEKAVEKLKAWKRLKDKGFKFDGWEDLQAEMGIDDLMLFNRDVLDTDNVIGFRMDDYHDCIKDLNTCFGGE